MALRTLIHQGNEWTVWDVVPSLETRLRVNPDGSPISGWLCFQSKTEKRRIAPVPEGWEDWPEAELVERLEAAQVVASSGVVLGMGTTRDSGSERLRQEVSDSMERARELGDRVRRAMNDGGARPLEAPVPSDDDWVERGPDDRQDR